MLITLALFCNQALGSPFKCMTVCICIGDINIALFITKLLHFGQGFIFDVLCFCYRLIIMIFFKHGDESILSNHLISYFQHTFAEVSFRGR